MATLRETLEEIDALAQHALLSQTVEGFTVFAGQDLQAAIDAARPGDTLLLEPATWTGHFVLPAKDGSLPVTIRTADTLRPGRIDPVAWRGYPLLMSLDNEPALQTAPGAHHYVLQGLAFAAGPQGEAGRDIVRFGDGSSAQTRLDQVPHHLVADRCCLRGSAQYGQKRGLALNSAASAVVDCYIDECKLKGQDSQALGGWNGPGPYVIRNNYLEGAGENVIFGGGDPPIPGLVTRGILFEGNDCVKPLAWRAERWQAKNLFELKNAEHVSVIGNTFDGSWSGFTQDGYALLLTPRNQDGGAPWVRVRHVLVARNVFRNTAGGIEILGADDSPGKPSQRTRGIQILDNTFEIDPVAWGSPDGMPGSGRAFVLLGGPEDIEIAHITVRGQHLNSFLTLDGPPVPRLVVRDSVSPEGDYGWKVDDGGCGLAAVLAHSPGSVLARNVALTQTPERWIDYGADNARQADDQVPANWATTDGAPVGANL